MKKENGLSLNNGATRLDPEHLKAKLDFETNSKKLNNEFWENLTENIFSSNFLVFIITCLVIASGFVFMNKSNAISEILDYWKLILPVVTTYIGYAIGKTGRK